MLSRADATDRLKEAKHDRQLSFTDLATAIDRDEVWTASLVFGDVSASEPEARTLCAELGIDDEAVVDALQREPYKGETEASIPSDPMLYRLYEIPQVYGDAIKACVHEEFGDGIMSAIDFECHVDRVEHDDGDRVRITYEGKFLPYGKW
ncbi:cyanase [Halobacteriales archaeon SW_6_65_46]|nr:MAG: cyanase [Halobacteriales archaeon SW_6_65_46]